MRSMNDAAKQVTGKKVNKLTRVFKAHAADAQAGEKCFARDM